MKMKIKLLILLLSMNSSFFFIHSQENVTKKTLPAKVSSAASKAVKMVGNGTDVILGLAFLGALMDAALREPSYLMGENLLHRIKSRRSKKAIGVLFFGSVITFSLLSNGVSELQKELRLSRRAAQLSSYLFKKYQSRSKAKKSEQSQKE